MAKHTPGPKELATIALRLMRYEERGPGATRKEKTETSRTVSKPQQPPVQASAPTKETTMKKRKIKAAGKPKKAKAATKKKQGLHPAIKSITSTGHKTTPIKPKAKKPKSEKKPVPALEVANFMARPMGATPGSPGGASMAELVKEFGIEAHPMRAKIFYIKNQMPGWDVENREGRYYATFTDSSTRDPRT